MIVYVTNKREPRTYAKLCRRPGGWGGGGVEEWIKRICPCFTPSRIALAEGARETVSLRGRLSTRFFCFFSQTRDCTTFTLQDSYIESVTAHRIKRNDHSCFHNSWPNSKTKLKLKHLWEQGAPWCFGGPMQPAYSAYREDRLWSPVQQASLEYGKAYIQQIEILHYIDFVRKKDDLNTVV